MRRTPGVMPELQRITRHHGIPEEVVSAIEELANAIHDATVAIRNTTRSISIRLCNWDLRDR